MLISKRNIQGKSPLRNGAHTQRSLILAGCISSKNPPTADEKAAKEREEEKRPHGDDRAPKATLADESEEEENRKHR